MPSQEPLIDRALLTGPSSGLVELSRDWTGDPCVPRFEPVQEVTTLNRLSPESFGLESGYFVDDENLVFVFDPGHYPWREPADPEIHLAGDFNGWHPTSDSGRWKLRAGVIAGRPVLTAAYPAADFGNEPFQFKFIDSSGRWLAPPDSAPNAVRNDGWNSNLEVHPARTGRHRFAFKTNQPFTLWENNRIFWANGETDESAFLIPGDFFYQMATERRQGAIPRDRNTTFRLFAPRAVSVEVHLFRAETGAAEEERFALRRRPDGCWEGRVKGNRHGWYYWYFVDGPDNPLTQFRPQFPIADPHALAVEGPAGPAVVVDDRRLPAPPKKRFTPPPMADLVVVELHTRDVLARSPLRLSYEERLGFGGLARWARESDYLSALGANAVELLPVQEFDNPRPEDYHWGYMPVNYYSPESGYATSPGQGSQIEEFAEVVRAFHNRGVAVILDVVYNHVGNPNNLLLIDKQYYFDLDARGGLMNWSGCGNDLRCNAAMARRLIIDSLLHWVRVFDVDGFRFDLAELLGVETLRDIESALRAEKPGILLIAEPWSFRGHVARQLRFTGYSSWNDGFRDFLPEFVRGRGSHEAVRYFFTGSQGAFAARPAQSVNYTESHDDHTWIDLITENPDHNGMEATPRDAVRTRLMAAFLFASAGIPMIAAGQDFLRSKGGLSNTYLRGDVNALNYQRLDHHDDTHLYFAGWIRFRLSEPGRLLRHSGRVTHTYWQFLFADPAPAFATVCNADGSAGTGRLLLAMNPTDATATLDLGELANRPWQKLADENRFFDSPRGEERPGSTLHLPPLGLGFWSLGETAVDS